MTTEKDVKATRIRQSAEDKKIASRKELQNAVKLAGLGMEFAAAILLFAGLGYLVDWYLGNIVPWGVVVGALTGFGIGIYGLFRLVSKLK
jgi:F0F1-type ATP synthase assembly protein I